MKRKAGAGRRLTFCFVAPLAASSAAGEAHPQSLHATQQAAEKSEVAQEKKAEERFSERAESLVSAAPVNRGDWGLLVVDAATGETLYEKNADKYFTPASNLKLLTTALALDKLGPDYRFRTTVETHGAIAQGVLSGDLILVGRGDPNLSNRKFPFDVKEEFDGPPEKVLIALADQIVARGVKEISGDIVGDDRSLTSWAAKRCCLSGRWVRRCALQAWLRSSCRTATRATWFGAAGWLHLLLRHLAGRGDLGVHQRGLPRTGFGPRARALAVLLTGS